MKNLLLLFAFFTVSTIISAQNNIAKKQKENITFPELLVFTDEFENFFSSKNKIEKIVSDKYFLEGPVWVEGIVVISRNVDVLVSKLRKKLRDDNSIKFINVHGRGYKFIIE